MTLHAELSPGELADLRRDPDWVLDISVGPGWVPPWQAVGSDSSLEYGEAVARLVGAPAPLGERAHFWAGLAEALATAGAAEEMRRYDEHPYPTAAEAIMRQGRAAKQVMWFEGSSGGHWGSWDGRVIQIQPRARLRYPRGSDLSPGWAPVRRTQRILCPEAARGVLEELG